MAEVSCLEMEIVIIIGHNSWHCAPCQARFSGQTSIDHHIWSKHKHVFGSLDVTFSRNQANFPLSSLDGKQKIRDFVGANLAPTCDGLPEEPTSILAGHSESQEETNLDQVPCLAGGALMAGVCNIEPFSFTEVTSSGRLNGLYDSVESQGGFCHMGHGVHLKDPVITSAGMSQHPTLCQPDGSVVLALKSANNGLQNAKDSYSGLVEQHDSNILANKSCHGLYNCRGRNVSSSNCLSGSGEDSEFSSEEETSTAISCVLDALERCMDSDRSLGVLQHLGAFMSPVCDTPTADNVLPNSHSSVSTVCFAERHTKDGLDTVYDVLSQTGGDRKYNDTHHSVPVSVDTVHQMGVGWGNCGLEPAASIMSLREANSCHLDSSTDSLTSTGSWKDDTDKEDVLRSVINVFRNYVSFSVGACSEMRERPAGEDKEGKVIDLPQRGEDVQGHDDLCSRLLMDVISEDLEHWDHRDSHTSPHMNNSADICDNSPSDCISKLSSWDVDSISKPRDKVSTTATSINDNVDNCSVSVNSTQDNTVARTAKSVTLKTVEKREKEVDSSTPGRTNFLILGECSEDFDLKSWPTSKRIKIAQGTIERQESTSKGSRVKSSTAKQSVGRKQSAKSKNNRMSQAKSVTSNEVKVKPFPSKLALRPGTRDQSWPHITTADDVKDLSGVLAGAGSLRTVTGEGISSKHFGNKLKKKDDKAAEGGSDAVLSGCQAPKPDGKAASVKVNPAKGKKGSRLNAAVSRKKKDGAESSDKWKVCSVCDRRFSTVGALNRHLKVNAGSSGICKCKVCHRKFHSLFQLNLHVYKCHETKAKPTCFKCNSQLAHVRGLAQHLQKHHGCLMNKSQNTPTKSRTFKCVICGVYILNQPSIVAAHQRKHATTRPFQCGQCQARFLTRSSLKVHMAAHTGRMFECDLCGLLFKNKASRYYHKLTHQSLRGDFLCQVCGQQFEFQHKLLAHVKIHSKEKKEKPSHSCVECGKVYKSKKNLKRHVSVDHQGIKDYQYKCEHCHQQFFSSWQLRDHIAWRHFGEKPYHCLICGQGFVCKPTLVRHQRKVHTGDKPHSCQYCGERFLEKHKLELHEVKAHTRVYPLHCPHCNKGFVRAAVLKCHLRTHTGERPHLCSICGKRFQKSNHLTRHSKVCAKKNAAVSAGSASSYMYDIGSLPDATLTAQLPQVITTYLSAPGGGNASILQLTSSLLEHTC
ncbi:uncharacterized protein LOC101847747 [Aplysia californica]|uniref:Uncharacterized protein LOC101847747 n=1 Tax=Aplysia californica TaxID=6500 RepID=A0ABM0JX22_APLCA|nr:uncharacterized protein LOC101847747 [Aplysia californica]